MALHTHINLRNLPSCHHFLATLYTKILEDSHQAPQFWCSGKIILIHKKGDTQTPENFRPIALTSTIGKVFHKILSRRLEKFCLQNGVIDSTTQKVFLHGVNGTMEHIFTTTSIIEHAKQNGLPVSISFLALKNAFGSVSHKLISDILYHIKLLTSVRDYINNT